MTDLRVGDEVFGPVLSNGRRPKASIGAAFLDSLGHAWVLVPKFFLAESGGNIFADYPREAAVAIDLSDATNLSAPPGGFVCVQVPPTMTISPHASSPSVRIPAVLEHVSIGNVSGQISGNKRDFALPKGEIEQHVLLISYVNSGKASPTIGGICIIDGGSIGVTVGVSRAKHLAAVVPWPSLRDRFRTQGLIPAQESDLRFRNNTIGASHASELNNKATQLAEWLEDRLGNSGNSRTARDSMTRLVSAIERLKLLDSFEMPLPALPQAFGGVRPSSWHELINLKQIREIAMGADGELVSSTHHPPEEITATTAELIAVALAGKHAYNAGEFE